MPLPANILEQDARCRAQWRFPEPEILSNRAGHLFLSGDRDAAAPLDAEAKRLRFANRSFVQRLQLALWTLDRTDVQVVTHTDGSIEALDFDTGEKARWDWDTGRDLLAG